MPKMLTWFRPGFHDKPQPIPDGHKILRLNDQHAVCEVPSDSPLAYGDMIGCGISHPCTTFDKWQLLYLVDDDYRVLGAIRTYF
jgi:D-serine dehydratase